MKFAIALLTFAIGICGFLYSKTPDKDEIRKINLQNQIELEAEIKKLTGGDVSKRAKGIKLLQRKLWKLKDGQGIFSIPIDSDINFDNKDETMLEQPGWAPVGPDVRGVSYDTLSGHGLGRINCVAFHPTNENILWIGSPGGGVWKTLDGGQTWTPLSDDMRSLEIAHIAVNPNNPDIVYATTGDFDGGYDPYNSGTCLGVFKSTDGGISWEETGLNPQESTFFYSYLHSTVINSDDPDKLIAAGMQGLWISNDAGETWEHKIEDFFFSDLDVSKEEPNVVYATTVQFGEDYGYPGVIKSTDFGETWVDLEVDFPYSGMLGRMSLDISEADENYIYVLASRLYPSSLHGIYRSKDAGETWETAYDGFTQANLLGWFDGDDTDQRGQGSYDLTILADPKDRDKIYVGGVNMWMSEDAGESFEPVSFWTAAFGNPNLHADQHFSAFNPLDDKYYICNDGGIYRTSKIEAGSASWITEWADRETEGVKPGYPGFCFPTVWENLTPGLAITQFYKLGTSRDNAGYITAGSQDNSCYYNNSQGWINYATNYDGMETMIDHYNPEIIYGSAQGGVLFRSDDGGQTQHRRITDYILYERGESGNWVTPFYMDPVNSETIYGLFDNVWKSTNKGETWEMFCETDRDSERPQDPNCMAIAPGDPDAVLISQNELDMSRWTHYTKHIYYTNDGGDSWGRISGDIPADSVSLRNIIFDEVDPLVFWLVFSSSYEYNNMYKTEDGGQTWTNVSKPNPGGSMISVVRDKNSDNNTFYAATSYNVFYTNDELDEWVLFDENLPNVEIKEIEINYPANKLYAATYGRGLWECDLIGSESSVEDDETERARFSVYPNPSAGPFSIKPEEEFLSNALNLRLEIVDIFGRTVYGANVDFGEGVVNINQELSSGKYYVKIISGEKTTVKSLIIQK
jgi:photosystem II stability/assembly factor-like uncharacterized protein